MLAGPASAGSAAVRPSPPAQLPPKAFRLTTAQAQRLYERGLQAARPGFFTVAVDSFPSDKPAWPRLLLGYYLVAHAEGPKLVYWLRAQTSRALPVIDNQTDPTLAGRDSLGQLLAGAQVAMGSQPLPYDPARLAIVYFPTKHGRTAGKRVNSK